MNKHDRQHLLSQIKGDFLEILATLAFIATAFTLAYGVKLVAEAVHGEEVIKEVDLKRQEKCNQLEKLVQECILRTPEGMWLGTADALCRKQAEEKLKK